MSQQLLHGADVITVSQEVCRKRVAEAVASRPLYQPNVPASHRLNLSHARPSLCADVLRAVALMTAAVSLHGLLLLRPSRTRIALTSKVNVLHMQAQLPPSAAAPLHRGAKRSTTCRREVGPRRFSPLRASVQQATASASEHGSPHQVRRVPGQARDDRETTTPRAPDCGIEALTRSLTAKWVRNALTSRSPISPGWRLSLKMMKRLIQ